MNRAHDIGYKTDIARGLREEGFKIEAVGIEAIGQAQATENCIERAAHYQRAVDCRDLALKYEREALRLEPAAGIA